jgi:Ni,Fe-hydrogenase I cytochrome b subunit
MKRWKTVFRRMVSAFLPGIPESYRRGDPVISIADTVALGAGYLRTFHFSLPVIILPMVIIVTYHPGDKNRIIRGLRSTDI